MTFPRSVSRFAHGRLNAVALRLAGRAALADLEHLGRCSGVVRHTPVRAFRRGDLVVVGANFGRESDWVKNVLAAGGCRMRLGEQQLQLGDPRLVPLRQGARGIPRWFGLGLRYVVRTVDCVELTVVGSAAVSRAISAAT